MTHNQKITEKIVILLLKLDQDADTLEQTMNAASNEAQDMAIRAYNGWWEVPGKPSYTERLMRIKGLLKKRKK